MFKLDLRSIALFRQCLALIGMVDLFLRGRFVQQFYSEDGMLPRVHAMAITEKWSLHFTSDSVYFQSTIFIIQAVFFFLLWMGWKPKLSSLVSWVLLLSMHARNEIINDGGDALFRHMLFWSMLLPSEAHFRTLAFEKVKRESYRFYDITSIGLIWLAVSVYTFSGWSKLMSPLWEGKAGVMNGLWAEWYVSSLGQGLRSLSVPFIQFINDWTMYMELLWVWLLFIPDELEMAGKKVNLSLAVLRFSVVGGFLALHIGIILFLALGSFPWLCLTLWMAFLPSKFWDWIRVDRLIHAVLPAPVEFAAENRSTRPAKTGFAWLSATAREPLGKKIDFLQQLVASIAIILGILWNASHVDYARFPNPNWSRKVSVQLGLEQGWNLFVRPEGVLAWLSVIGKYADGSVKEMGYLKDLPSVHEKPKLLSALYPSYRWREVDFRFMWGHFDQLRVPLFLYLCRTNPGLRSFMITQYMIVVESQIEGRVAPIRERPRGEWECFPNLLEEDRESILEFKAKQK